MKIWVKDPIAVLAEGAERGVIVEGTKIVELVGKGKEPMTHVDQTFDASGHVVIPGLINTHHHMFQTLTRAHPSAINKELFPWLEALFPIWAKHVNPDNLRLATRLALTELMMSGCTTASDHQYLFPPGTESAMDIQAEEAANVGMRMVLNRGALNLTTEEGGNAFPGAVQDTDDILADCERVIGRYHDPREGAMLQVALAPCAPFNVTKRLMIESAKLAEKHNCRLHTHLAETRDEIDYCEAKFQCRPVDYLEEVGWMTNRAWRTASTSTTTRSGGLAGMASASVTARRRTWCLLRASAGRGSWKPQDRRSASAWTDRHPTTIPTLWRASATRS
jgi:8-oxoguanine deaminase